MLTKEKKQKEANEVAPFIHFQSRNAIRRFVQRKQIEEDVTSMHEFTAQYKDIKVEETPACVYDDIELAIEEHFGFSHEVK